MYLFSRAPKATMGWMHTCADAKREVWFPAGAACTFCAMPPPNFTRVKL